MPRSKAIPIQNLEAKAANAKEIVVTVAKKGPQLERGLAQNVQLYSEEKGKPEQLTPILCFLKSISKPCKRVTISTC